MAHSPRAEGDSSNDLQDALLRRLTPAERLHRAMALSAAVRTLAMAGAAHTVGVSDLRAVRRRFLTQVYGDAFAAWVDARTGP